MKVVIIHEIEDTLTELSGITGWLKNIPIVAKLYLLTWHERGWDKDGEAVYTEVYTAPWTADNLAKVLD